MGARVLVPRLADRPQRDDPCDEHGGWFLWNVGEHGSITDSLVLFKCPLCLKPAALRAHLVGRDGSVTPSVVCPFAPCAFHEFVTLDAWPVTWDKQPGHPCPSVHLR